MSQVARWAERLFECAAAANVPGAVLGISYKGERIVVPYGVLSTATGVATTVDSVFQIGSITKLWTATMVMQLVDEGRLTLGSTVAQLLPGVRLGAHDVAEQVTVRHLLTHSSGFEGDVNEDTGRGDDCVEKFVALLAYAPQIHPVGAAYSYSNAAFTLLGRVIEVLDGTGWDEALRRRLIEPLGLTATVTLPEDALLHRAAVGHKAYPRASESVDTWGLWRNDGPSGLITQSANDLLCFAELHLNHGVTTAGRTVLSAQSAAAMLIEQVRPAESEQFAVGLAWRLEEWDGRRVIGHDGVTLGQQAFLRVDPEAGLAVCLLTNSPEAPILYQQIVPDVMEQYVGVRLPDQLAPVDAAPHRPERHIGRYESAVTQVDITARPMGRLRMTRTWKGNMAALISDPAGSEYELLPVDSSGDRYALRPHRGHPWEHVKFDRLPDGTPYLFAGARLMPKVD